MAEEKIEISVEFDGGQEAARELGEVTTSVQQVGRTAESAGQRLTDFARTAQAGAQRVQGVAGAVQSLVSAFGSENRTAGLIASVAGATAQFAAMGSMLGPAGTVVGGLVGLTAGLVSAYNASQDTAEGIREVGDAAASAEEDVRRFNAALQERARQSELDLGVAAVREYDEEIIRVTASLEGMRSEFDAMPIESAGSPAERALNRRIRDTTARLEELRGLRSSAAEEETAIMMESLAESAAEEPSTARRRGGGGAGARAGVSDANDEMAIWEATMRSIAEERAAEETAWQETLAGINSDVENSIAERELMREKESEAERERLEAEAEFAAEVNERRLEQERSMYRKRQDIEEQSQDKLQEMTDRRQQQRESEHQEIMGMVGETTMQLGKSIAAVAKGEQTAEQAFLGFTKSFLEMISQYTALKAATEFAEAGGAFARYDYSGGAMHIAAGVAYTAVSVATGVGAAAINTAPSAPARPEAQSMGGTEGGGGEVVINWNSPVVTAGTYADLGRELQTAVEAAGSI